MQRHIFLLFLSLICNYLFAQTQPPFETEIRAFERLDSIEKTAKGQILLYGNADTLHLNAKGYEVWAKVTREFLKKQRL